MDKKDHHKAVAAVIDLVKEKGDVAFEALVYALSRNQNQKELAALLDEKLCAKYIESSEKSGILSHFCYLV